MIAPLTYRVSSSVVAVPALKVGVVWMRNRNQALRRTGWSFWNAANASTAEMSPGSRIGVVFENLVVRCPGGQKVEHIFHADAKAPDAGAATTYGRVDGNPVNPTHASSARRLSAERLS